MRKISAVETSLGTTFAADSISQEHSIVPTSLEIHKRQWNWFFKTLISGRGSLDEATASSVPWTFRFFENLINFVVAVKNCSCGCGVPTAYDYQNKIADSISTMVHYLSPSVQWRCCKKCRSYPYDPTVESCRSLAREQSVVQRLFNYPYISVESDKTHSQYRSNS